MHPHEPHQHRVPTTTIGWMWHMLKERYRDVTRSGMPNKLSHLGERTLGLPAWAPLRAMNLVLDARKRAIVAAQIRRMERELPSRKPDHAIFERGMYGLRNSMFYPKGMPDDVAMYIASEHQLHAIELLRMKAHNEEAAAKKEGKTLPEGRLTRLQLDTLLQDAKAMSAFVSNYAALVSQMHHYGRTEKNVKYEKELLDEALKLSAIWGKNSTVLEQVEKEFGKLWADAAKMSSVVRGPRPAP